jgi:uncharacterized protein (DUF58 family)
LSVSRPAGSDQRSEGAAGGPLLDAPLLAALASLSLPLHRARGAHLGHHAGSLPGRGDDFFQHRGYVRGDDVRAVDFRASARTGRLMIKEQHRPQRQPLALLLDTSASMGFPREGRAKLRAAQQLAAALAFLALRRGDPVALWAAGSARFAPLGRALPGGRPALEAQSLLERARLSGAADLPAALAALPAGAFAGAHVVVLSDLYGDPGQVAEGLSRIAAEGAALSVLHVLGVADVQLPPAARVRDAETGEEREAGAEERAALAARVEPWREGLAAAVARAGAEWRAVDAGTGAAVTLRDWLA